MILTTERRWLAMRGGRYTVGIVVMKPEEMAEATSIEFAPSDWLVVSQEMIDQFANCTDDHQAIHVDPKAAIGLGLDGTIAHGFLSLSLIPKLVADFRVLPENTVMGMNYGFNKVRFLSPVPSGSRIRAHMRITNVERKTPSQFVMTHLVEIEIEGKQKPALVAEWLNMLVTD